METPVSPIEVTLAQPNDLASLRELIIKANEYSVAVSGKPQWKDWSIVLPRLEKFLEDNKTHVVRQEENITGAISLNESDPAWGEASSDGNALYIHQLMKDPEIDQKGIGALLLGFAAKEAIVRNKSFLRCDTAEDLPTLIDYYKKFGFKEVGSIKYPTFDRKGILLEALPSNVLQISEAV